MTRCTRCNGNVLYDRREGVAKCIACSHELPDAEESPLVAPLLGLLREPRMSVKGRAKGSHCLRGHPFTPANTYERKGTRRCRRCDALRAAMRKQGRLAE